MAYIPTNFDMSERVFLPPFSTCEQQSQFSMYVQLIGLHSQCMNTAAIDIIPYNLTQSLITRNLAWLLSRISLSITILLIFITKFLSTYPVVTSSYSWQ